MNDDNKNKPYAAIIPTHLPTLCVPIVFVPGIMATRLEVNGIPIWDPDKKISMLKMAFMRKESKNKLLGIEKNKSAKPITNDPGEKYSKGQISRGFGECYSGAYENLIKHLDEDFFNTPRNMLSQMDILAPVHVFGYDWRVDYKTITKNLSDRFEKLKEDYTDSNVKPDDVPFIIVTHSMGGLVIRKMLQDYPKLAKQVLGVIHGNQPAIGSPKFYGYFKAGAKQVNKESNVINFSKGPIDFLIDNFITPKVLTEIQGPTDMEFQYLTCSLPGSLILLPTNDYENKKWLTWDIRSNDGKKAIKGFGDDGKIISSKNIYDYYRDKSGYLGLLNKSFIRDNKKMSEMFFKSLEYAENFHKEIGEGKNIFAHHETYEVSSDDLKTLQGVHLEETKSNENGFNEVFASRQWEKVPVEKDDLKVNLKFSERGDGTVPLSSQTILSDKNKVFGKFTGGTVEHSASFNNSNELIAYTADTIEKILMRYTGSVYFASNSSSVTDEYKKKLNRVIRLMCSNENIKFKVSGYTSQEGDAQYNLKLSKERSKAVADYIVGEIARRKKLPLKECQDRLITESKGAVRDEPDNEETRKLYRRVSLVRC